MSGPPSRQHSAGKSRPSMIQCDCDSESFQMHAIKEKARGQGISLNGAAMRLPTLETAPHAFRQSNSSGH